MHMCVPKKNHFQTQPRHVDCGAPAAKLSMLFGLLTVHLSKLEIGAAVYINSKYDVLSIFDLLFQSAFVLS